MSTFKKHVGRIKNTDRRCVVIYMQIPGNENNALIVDTDSLPDRFHDALMTIVDSNEGQQTVHLHTLLARRILPDMGVDILNALHLNGLLRAVDIDNIVMYPAPNAPCALRTIVDFINGESAPKEEEVQLENRVLENQKVEASQAQIDIASNILRQAQDLEEEAARKREQAYRMVPSLRPVVESEVATVITSDNGNSNTEVSVNPQVTPSPNVTETSVSVNEHVLESPAAPVEAPNDVLAPSASVEVEVFDNDLPQDVLAALEAAKIQLTETLQTSSFDSDDEISGNQVDTSDEAIQAFLDRAALREDMEDREKWLAMQPKNPVGRPRKDGLPAGTKAEPVAVPKKRGRPPKNSK